MEPTKASLFDYPLPPQAIAQEPVSPRDQSNLLVCTKSGQKYGCAHRKFFELDQVLDSNDFLIFNDAKVLPVRLLGNRLLDNGEKGGAVELLLTRKFSENEYSTLTKLSAKPKVGMRFQFDPHLIATVTATPSADSETRVQFAIEKLEPWLIQHGHVPLPPYIARDDNKADLSLYQTVYAQKTGSAAAPTAGFHFTSELLERLRKKETDHAMVTLHVGVGTFRPIKTETLEEHEMHEEHYEISQNFAESFQRARLQNKNIVAVGTTVVRTLESWVRTCRDRNIEPGSPESVGIFSTKLFIRPGFEFQAVDDLITNFHLPRSTLLVLIAAMMGVENMHQVYKLAIENAYRFFSYGDAMFIRNMRSKK